MSSEAIRRAAIVVAGTVALVALFLVLRDDGGGAAIDGATSERTTTQAPTTPGPTTPHPSPRPRPRRARPNAVELDIVVGRGNRVAGGIQRATARKGQRVVISVTAPVADEVHVHGYDITRDIRPGRRARIGFRATLVGRFVIELEERHLHIGELEVRP